LAASLISFRLAADMVLPFIGDGLPFVLTRSETRRHFTHLADRPSHRDLSELNDPRGCQILHLVHRFSPAAVFER
jgi:hypothetical protein